jgi:hypothetical protein
MLQYLLVLLMTQGPDPKWEVLNFVRRILSYTPMQTARMEVISRYDEPIRDLLKEEEFFPYGVPHMYSSDCTYTAFINKRNQRVMLCLGTAKLRVSILKPTMWEEPE